MPVGADRLSSDRAPAEALSATFDFGQQAVEILERMDEGFYAVDRDWRLVYVNAAAERFWKRPREELVGQTMFQAFPKFQGSDAHRAHREALESGVEARVETVSTATGTPVELGLYPSPLGLTVIFRDISRRLQLEETLRERDEILTLAELSAGIGVWDSDLATEMVRGTPQFFRLHGLEPSIEPVSVELPRSVRHPQDSDRLVLGFADALASGTSAYENEYRIIRPDGEVRWIFGRGRIIRNAEGVPVRYSGVDIDITARKRNEERLRIVTSELQHRTNNLLAVIQAMARQTAMTSDSLDDFADRFGARLVGLAHSNDLLVRQDWRGGSLEELIRTQLAPFVGPDEGRLSASGPNVVLKPGAVQTIGLALHELATNASKYGALSQPGGRLAITWETEGSGDGGRLRVAWRESGGPKVRRPRRQGFGRFVIESMIKSTLGATVANEFARDGLSWTAEIPLEHVVRHDDRDPDERTY